MQQIKNKFENEKNKLCENQNKAEKKIQTINLKLKFIQEAYVQEQFQNEKNKKLIKQLIE